MSLHRLQTRFILAGCLLVAATIGSGLWSALTFARLSAAADNALRENQQKIALTAKLARALEREDDALLVALARSDDQPARAALGKQRELTDSHYSDLVKALNGDPQGPALAKDIQQRIDAYRGAGTALIEKADGAAALEQYHRDVNPLLRRAVTACDDLREESFASLGQAGVRARDAAGWATWIVTGVSLAAIALAIFVSVWLARSVLRPIAALTESVEAVRQGDFNRRVTPSSVEELGRLAEGFNRMAETLGDYRASSLGELLAAKYTLEATLHALPDAVLVIAPDGALEAMNPPARTLLDAMQVPKATQLQELPLRADLRAAIDGALAGRPYMSSRTDFAQALQIAIGGRPRRLLLAVVPIPEFEPHRFGAAVVLEDITEFARLDELRGDLIGMASHELKSPLTAIQLNLQLLNEDAGELPAPQRESLNEALHGCRDLTATINEMLDVTRAQAGQLRLEPTSVDLVALVEQVAHGMRPRYEVARVGLRLILDQPSVHVHGDAARLANVVTNLLTNALKYSPPGSNVTARVSRGTTAKSDGPPMIDVSVTDQGPGVPAEFRERIFDKFFRVEHLRDGPKKVAGTGLGLYLCREIMRAHGGSIHCEAGEGGVGTKVVFSLPSELPPK
jgi:NtrC-family two-component system sensor histidine kinase KinB